MAVDKRDIAHPPVLLQPEPMKAPDKKYRNVFPWSTVCEWYKDIRDFPYYATFREKGAKLACADKLGVFLSLTLCKKASFEYLAFIK